MQQLIKLIGADEFDLPFGELIDEPIYKKYKYISDTLKYLGWEFDEIIENDIIDKEDIEERRYGRILKENFYKMPFHKFADYVDKYAKFLENGDD